MEFTKEQIDYLANRFLGWKLPDDFSPDNGISFEPLGNKGTKWEYKHEPIGTNLLNAIQATQMITYLLEGLPDVVSHDKEEAENELDSSSQLVAKIRSAGWTVAVHNDYKLNGVFHTFWLFTKDDKAVKGEGRSDTEALLEILSKISV